MSKKSDKCDKVILDVFEIINHKPVFKYKINVADKFIILLSNNYVPQTGVSKCINESVREKLVLSELTDIEKFDFKGQLTHKFQINSLAWKNLYLNLTDNELVKLGFKEKPKSLWRKLIDFSVNDFWIWIERIGFVIAIMGSPFLLNLCN